MVHDQAIYNEGPNKHSSTQPLLKPLIKSGTVPHSGFVPHIIYIRQYIDDMIVPPKSTGAQKGWQSSF